MKPIRKKRTEERTHHTKNFLVRRVRFFEFVKSCIMHLPFSRYRGPMVAGIPPREASDRLGIFQARFDELWRKYETYSGERSS